MRVAALLLQALALLGLGLGLGDAAAQALFRGDAARSGVAASDAPRGPPRPKWVFPTGQRIVSSAVWHRGLVLFGSDDGHLYAVDAGGGVQRWKAATGGPVSSSPAVDGDRVFVTSYDGRLHALDAGSGELLWKFVTEGERRFEARGLHGQRPSSQTFADPFDVYLSSPVVALGLVFFGSGDGHLYAVDAASGALRWKLRTGDVVHGSPAYADGLVVVGSWDGKVYGVDALSGRLRWQFQGGVDPLLHNQQGFQASPAIAQGLVYIGGRDAHLYALDAATGQERWRFATGNSWVISSPAVHAGRVYFATSDTSLVHALDAASGKPLWQQQGQAYVFSSPVIAGPVLLLGVLNGSLEARDLASGERLWSWRTEAAQANPGWALTADGRINADMLYTQGWHESMAQGALRQFSIGAIFAAPLVVQRVIYIGSADGRLVALE